MRKRTNLIQWIRIWSLTLKLAITDIANIHLGDQVSYLGKIWSVSNGVSRPYWTLVRGTHGVDHEYLEYVHQKDFKVVPGFRTYYFRFTSTWRFYR